MSWISIDDEIPKLFTRIIFWHPENARIDIGRAMTDGVHVNGYVYKCTHWMLIPEAPE